MDKTTDLEKGATEHAAKSDWKEIVVASNLNSETLRVARRVAQSCEVVIALHGIQFRDLPSKQTAEPDHTSENTGVGDVEVFVVSNFRRD